MTTKQHHRRFEITLDMVLEKTRNRMNRICVQGQTRADIKRYNLSSVVLQEVGPGGGNAEVRLYGSHSKICLYIREVYCPNDPEDAEFHISRIIRYTGAAECVKL